MRTWIRAGLAKRCGGCGTVLEAGVPVQLVRIGHITKIRGECCVGPAPADVPDLVEMSQAIEPRLVLKHATRVLPFDYKAVAAGDRDPGEEG